MVTFVVGVLVVIMIGAMMAWIMVGPSRPEPPRDLRRAGESEAPSGEAVARRAIGRTSWMRFPPGF